MFREDVIQKKELGSYAIGHLADGGGLDLERGRAMKRDSQLETNVKHRIKKHRVDLLWIEEWKELM